MLRLLALIVIIGAVAFGIAARTRSYGPAGCAEKRRCDDSASRDIGPPLFRPQPRAAIDPNVVSADNQAIVVPHCRLGVIDKQEVPSERDGVLLFIGTEIRPGETVPPKLLIEVEIGGVKRTFRRLVEGDEVQKGQLLAYLDDRLSRDDWIIKQARVASAQADLKAAEKIAAELKTIYETRFRLSQNNVVATEEVRKAKLNWDNAAFDVVRKREALTLAERELSQARTVLEMHAIRSAMSGVIKTIYKQPREAVRRLEPVFLIQSHDRLRVEGLVDVEHVTQLRKGMQANIEPNEPQAPETILLGHLERIQAVAVTSQGEIVSGGADRTVRVWDRASKRERLTLSFPAAITSLACTSPPASRQLMVVGCGNGSVMICEVKDGTPLWQAQGEHLGAVTSAAFSPDGQWCATGGEDRSIIVWEVATGNVRYRLPEGHRGAVTWLSFTPQAELVSAARDNTIRLWSLGEKGASIRATFAHRSGEVTQPGTSADGQWTLYDDGGALRLLTLPTGRNAAIFHHPSKAARFSGFALLAPNGNTLVTSTAAGNVLDLWPTPRLSGRLVPLRQLLLLPGSQATCAAFAPDASFLCAGTDDRRILVWELPSDFEQRRPHVATLTLIERDVASTSPQVRVRAELPNAGGRLLPGMTATMVVPLR